jgi:hypothetical protein
MQNDLRFKNRKSFSGFILFSFVGTFMGIRHRWALEFDDSPNLPLKILEFRYPIVGFRCPQLPLDSGKIGWNLALVRRNPVTSGTVVGFWRPDSDETGRNMGWPNSGKTSRNSAILS